MNKRRIYGIIFMVLSFILALIPRYIAPTCPLAHEGKVMQCYHMGNALMGISGALVILAILFIAVKEDKTALGLIYSQIIVGMLAIIMPLKIIGTCGSPSMRCNIHTKPAIVLVAGLYVFINIIYAWRNGNEPDRNKESV